jgi:hypothetical protein
MPIEKRRRPAGTQEMSQKTVQLIVGRLVTDEEFRLRFLENPRQALDALRDRGFDLTNGEIEALLRTDRSIWIDVSSRLDPQLQQCRLVGD